MSGTHVHKDSCYLAYFESYFTRALKFLGWTPPVTVQGHKTQKSNNGLKYLSVPLAAVTKQKLNCFFTLQKLEKNKVSVQKAGLWSMFQDVTRQCPSALFTSPPPARAVLIVQPARE